MNMLTPSVQIPPLRQGSVRQSFMLTSHKLPEKPTGHVHVVELALVVVQAPPLRQGEDEHRSERKRE